MILISSFILFCILNTLTRKSERQTYLKTQPVLPIQIQCNIPVQPFQEQEKIIDTHVYTAHPYPSLLSYSTEVKILEEFLSFATVTKELNNNL